MELSNIELKEKNTIGINTDDTLNNVDISNNIINQKITYNIESPRVKSKMQPYELINYNRNSRLDSGHNFCIIINYIIISVSLLLITILIYNLLNKINAIDINKIVDIFSNVSTNFNEVTLFISDTQKFANNNQDFILDIQQFIFEIKKIIKFLDNIDSKQIQNLIFEVNYTLCNINNKLNTIENKYGSFDNINTITNFQDITRPYDENVPIEPLETFDKTTELIPSESDSSSSSPSSSSPSQTPQTPSAASSDGIPSFP
tara:strand:- start:116 stop:895 length:780 start_codon:yes stop_codon:yes gene_type:complete